MLYSKGTSVQLFSVLSEIAVTRTSQVELFAIAASVLDVVTPSSVTASGSPAGTVTENTLVSVQWA